MGSVVCSECPVDMTCPQGAAGCGSAECFSTEAEARTEGCRGCLGGGRKGEEAGTSQVLGPEEEERQRLHGVKLWQGLGLG